MKIKCQICSKEFITYPNWIERGGGKFCSPKCAGVPRDKKVLVTCEICGKQRRVKPSIIRHSGAKYCSHACQQLGMVGKKRPDCSGEKSSKWKDGRTLRPNFCANCGKKTKDHRSIWCKSCSKKAELHPNWKGGIALLPYSPFFTVELKDRIRQRDRNICQLCNLTEEEHILIYSKVLTVHHIDYDKQNSDEQNLITLCTQCNFKVNYNRTYWTEIFTHKLKEKCDEKVI